jgi:hypothetical protein
MWECNTHGQMRNSCIILVENLKVRDYKEDLRMDGKLILRETVRK